MSKLTFTLVTPEAEAFSGQVDSVSAPGVEGNFGAFPAHAPFMTTLKEGPVAIMQGGEETVFHIRGGFADVTPDGVTILAEAIVSEGEAA